MITFMKLYFVKKPGIGLIEAIAAIGILITGIISVVALAQSNLAYSQGVEARMTATNLAREGVEVVRSIRDSNWLKGKTADTNLANAWDEGLEFDSDPTAIPVLNITSLIWTLNPAVDNMNEEGAKITGHPAKNLYRQRPNIVPPDTITTYSRLLTLYAICYDALGNKVAGDQAQCTGTNIKGGIKVISRVEWEEAGRRLSIEVEEWLYNWRFSNKPYEP